MRINTNIAAMNSYNQLNQTNGEMENSLEKLSSGKRINSAADDAAGLAISEKMSSQTRGLAQAQRNAQNGISMIQTAEGALKESHSILQRMRELSVQSANDTNTEADRKEIQKEVDQLAGELSRISNNTEFNTQTLLNGAVQEGSEGKATFHIGANEDQNLSLEMSAMDASSLGVAEDVASKSAEVSDTSSGVIGADIDGEAYFEEGDYTVEFNSSGTEATLLDSEGEVVDTNSGLTNSSSGTVTFTNDDGGEVTIAKDASDMSDASETINIGAAGADLSESNATATDGVQMSTDDALEEGDYTIEYSVTSGVDSATITNSDGDTVGQVSGLGGTTTATTESITLDNGESVDVTIDAGAAADGDTAEFSVTHSDYESGTSSAAEDTNGDGKIDTNASVAKGIDVRTQENANDAIETIDSAIEDVSAERSKLGAYQNRLDHTINNLNASQENLTAAESRISDVDMAKEMMNLSKQRILNQAGTAMLAQANQKSQGVMQLLG